MENGINFEEDEVPPEPPPKKIKSEWSKSYSNKAMQMMVKMGYEDDKGLGKQKQGRLEPVVATQQDGRRGLGLKLDTLQTSAKKWDPSCEKLLIPEKVCWLNSNTEYCEYDADTMRHWIIFGNKKLTIDDETRFCDSTILARILEAKTVFDDLNDGDKRRARSRSNPFETIRSSIFLNRAAVKMANIDSMCDFMFTEPKDRMGNPLVKNHELLYFADICAGPGGFTEYVLFKKKWEAKGFGFTLRGANDFKLDKFFAGSPESFDPYYGVENDGNVFFESNQDSLAEYIWKHNPSGVHFVMADGGFSVYGQENIQEILSKQLYLCQCLTALKILKTDGSFVCKLFDLFTPFSVGLVYLMYKCFHQISIIKPNSSRPANSERYIVCKWKKSDTHEICEYLNHINNYLNEGRDDDILEIVDYNIIAADNMFMGYITESNNIIGENQIVGLRKIAAFCQDTELKEPKQSEYRKRCLELWKLPDQLRHAPEVIPPDKLLEELLEDWYDDKEVLSAQATELCTMEDVDKKIESIYDWYFVPIGRCETNINTCSIFLCKSRGNLLRYADNKKWEPVEYMFEISPKSLFFGEIVYEYHGEGRTQTRVYGLHIIDAIVLGGINIRRYKFSDRVKMCKKYAESVNKPFKDGKHLSIRSKKIYALIELQKFFADMRHYNLKDNTFRLGFELKSSGRFFVPGGILLFCEIQFQYFSKMSKSRRMLYYYDKKNNKSDYKELMSIEMQKSLYASFRNSFQRRLLWKWTNLKQVESGNSSTSQDSNLLFRDDLQRFLTDKLNE